MISSTTIRLLLLFYTLCSISLDINYCWANAASPSSTTTTSSWSTTLLEEMSLNNQDAYVAASPLSVAVVCRDGIAIVSLHHAVDVEESDRKSDDDEEFDVPNNETGADGNAKLFRDLPLSSRGPLRIEPIYENNHLSSSLTKSSSSSSVPPPMSLLTAGWRTDGIALSDAARELMAEEVRLYCLPALVLMEQQRQHYDQDEDELYHGTDDDDEEGRLLEGSVGKPYHPNTANDIVLKSDNSSGDGTITNTISQQLPQQQHQSYHGRRIAEGLSYHLAKCSFSEGVRSLSTVGLLACGATTGSGRGQHHHDKQQQHRQGGGGSLYLVDATGTHSVRAHAIGYGSVALHRRMVFVDFDTMDCREGLKVLLQLIAEEGGLAEEGEAEVDEASEDALLEDGEKKKMVLGGNFLTKPAFFRRGKEQKQEKEEEEEQPWKWNLPSNTAVELAVLRSGDGRMRRVRLASLQ